MQKVSGKMIGCLEEIALENGWISAEQARDAAERMEKTRYGGVFEENDWRRVI